MNIVVFGANSDIAKELLRREALNNEFLLISQNQEKLENLKGDLSARGARVVHTLVFQNNTSLMYEEVKKVFRKIDQLIIAHGSLPIQLEVENNPKLLEELTYTNFTSYAQILTAFAKDFENQKEGSIIVFTSVAGDRGRRSNYIYGSLKAAKQAFLEGFSARMSRSNVHVLDVRPGMVDTVMTAHLQKGLLFSSPTHVASDIHKAIRKKKAVLYTPFFWKWIMLIIKSIPRKVFYKLNF